MEMALDALRPGVWATIVQIGCAPALCRRLEDFALIPGTRVQCRWRAERSGLTALQLRHSVVALRLSDARRIRIRTEA